MFPELLKIGPFTLRSYGLCMALGFIAAFQIWRWLLRGTRWDANALSNLLVWLISGGIIGARMAYVIEHIGDFPNPLEWFMLWRGGLMFYGGFLGGGLAVVIFALVYRVPLLELLDIVTVGLPVGHAIGRIGCFLNGCCHGSVTAGALGVCFPRGSEAFIQQNMQGLLPAYAHRSLPVHPVQLFESFGNVLILVLLLFVFRRKQRSGLVTATYLLCYPTLRFLVERFRADPRMTVGAFSIAQAISIALFVVGLLLMFVILGSPAPRQDTAAASDA